MWKFLKRLICKVKSHKLEDYTPTIGDAIWWGDWYDRETTYKRCSRCGVVFKKLKLKERKTSDFFRQSPREFHDDCGDRD